MNIWNLNTFYTDLGAFFSQNDERLAVSVSVSEEVSKNKFLNGINFVEIQGHSSENKQINNLKAY